MEKYLYQDLYDLEQKHWWHIAKRRTCLDLLKQFISKKDNKILDYGCGTGENVKEFSSLGESFGIDISKDAIEFCKKRGLRNIRLVHDEKIPFMDKEFDIVSLLDVLEHVAEKESLQEVRRVLQDNGLILITVPAFTWLWSKWDEMLHHKRRYTKKSLEKVLKENGFEVLRISYMYSFLVLPALLVRYIKSIFFKNQYPSDFQIGSPFINSLFLLKSDAERFFILRGLVPFGTSIICIAKKR